MLRQEAEQLGAGQNEVKAHISEVELAMKRNLDICQENVRRDLLEVDRTTRENISELKSQVRDITETWSTEQGRLQQVVSVTEQRALVLNASQEERLRELQESLTAQQSAQERLTVAAMEAMVSRELSALTVRLESSMDAKISEEDERREVRLLAVTSGSGEMESRVQRLLQQQASEIIDLQNRNFTSSERDQALEALMRETRKELGLEVQQFACELGKVNTLVSQLDTNMRSVELQVKNLTKNEEW